MYATATISTQADTIKNQSLLNIYHDEQPPRAKHISSWPCVYIKLILYLNGHCKATQKNTKYIYNISLEDSRFKFTLKIRNISICYGVC